MAMRELSERNRRPTQRAYGKDSSARKKVGGGDAKSGGGFKTRSPNSYTFESNVSCLLQFNQFQ